MPPTAPRGRRRAAHRPRTGRTSPGRPDDTQPTPTSDAPGTAGTRLPTPVSARAAGPASRAADFGIDTTTKTTSEAIRAYLQNLRNGELGALPALLGLLALFILFTALDSSGTFPSLLNLANLLQQGAGQTVIAMGLVFVLLIGEIDLAAGTASGLAAAVMALHLVRTATCSARWAPRCSSPSSRSWRVAVALAVWLRIWVGRPFAALGLVLLLVGFPPNAWLEMLLAVCSGVVIGVLTGFLGREGRHAVVRGHPRAVHRLAGRDPAAHRRRRHAGPARPGARRGGQRQHVDASGSWMLFLVAAGGYAAVLLNRQFSRRQARPRRPAHRAWC